MDQLSLGLSSNELDRRLVAIHEDPGFRIEQPNGVNASFEENLETILRAFFKVIDESPEAFLFVQDHLRQFWAQLPSEVRKQSILRQIQRLIEQGQRDREVTGTLSPRILVAAFVGFLTQLARMLHFNEFGDAADWQREAMIVAKKIFRR